MDEQTADLMEAHLEHLMEQHWIWEITYREDYDTAHHTQEAPA